MKTIEYFELIRQWARDRNLIEGSTPKDQFLKLMEEWGETLQAIDARSKEEIKDGIGDCCVVLTIMLAQLGYSSREVQINILSINYENHICAMLCSLASELSRKEYSNAALTIDHLLDCMWAYAHRHHTFTLNECLETAWNSIKDRKGKMVDGIFVKESDYADNS